MKQFLRRRNGTAHMISKEEIFYLNYRISFEEFFEVKRKKMSINKMGFPRLFRRKFILRFVTQDYNYCNHSKLHDSIKISAFCGKQL